MHTCAVDHLLHVEESVVSEKAERQSSEKELLVRYVECIKTRQDFTTTAAFPLIGRSFPGDPGLSSDHFRD